MKQKNILNYFIFLAIILILLIIMNIYALSDLPKKHAQETVQYLLEQSIEQNIKQNNEQINEQSKNEQFLSCK